MNQKNGLTIKFSIGYLGLYVAVLLAFAFGMACWYAKSTPDARAVIAYGSSLFGAMVAIGSLLYTARNLKIANDEKHSVAASKFVERWNSPSYTPLKATFREILESLQKLTPEQRSNSLHENFANRATVVEIFNFFEEMCVGVNTESLDEDLLKRFFGTVLVYYWDNFSYWVTQHRINKNGPRFFCEFEEVVNKWKKGTS